MSASASKKTVKGVAHPTPAPQSVPAKSRKPRPGKTSAPAQPAPQEPLPVLEPQEPLPVLEPAPLTLESVREMMQQFLVPQPKKRKAPSPKVPQPPQKRQKVPQSKQNAQAKAQLKPKALKAQPRQKVSKVQPKVKSKAPQRSNPKPKSAPALRKVLPLKPKAQPAKAQAKPPPARVQYVAHAATPARAGGHGGQDPKAPRFGHTYSQIFGR